MQHKSGPSRPLANHPTTPIPGERRGLPDHIGLSLLLFVYSCYLVFYSGIFHSSDAQFIVAATESMVKRLEFSTDQLWWHQDAIESVAPDDEPYSKYGISASLLAAPLYILALKWPSLGMVQAVMLTNLLVTAVNGVFLYKLARSMGYRTGVALSVSLMFALGTSAMVYSRYYFTEPISALALTGAFFGLYMYRSRRQNGYAWLAGAAMSLAVSTKLINTLFLVPVAVYAFYRSPSTVPGRPALLGVRKAIEALFPIGLLLVITFAILGAYNALRFGSPLITGYPTWERFDHPLLAGVWGLLLSNEKGLFWYNPLLFASLLAFPLFWRRHRREAQAVLGIAVLHVIAYASWHDWRGGVAWGPRFLVPLLPLLVLPLAPLLESLWPDGSGAQFDRAHQAARARRPTLGIGRVWKWVARAGLLAVAGLSVGVQVVGSGVSFLSYGAYFDQLVAGTGPVVYELGRKWPILGHALLFEPANWDMAWVHLRGSKPTIDWGALGALAILLSLTVIGLVFSYRGRRRPPHRRMYYYPAALVLISILVSLALLIRFRDNNRFGGGDDYRETLISLEAVSRPDDLVLLGNHIYTDYFLNHNRSLARWYALDQGAATSDRTIDLLDRSVQRYRRIWLVTDLSPEFASVRPLEAWLTQRAYKVDELVFGPYARLLLYDTRANAPAARQSLEMRLGDSIKLVAFDLGFTTRSEPVRLTLYWRALGSVTQDYTVFLQLLDAGDQLAWQVDRFPVDGFRLTTSWQVGETVTDRYGWQIPPDLPSGEYRLITGLYDWKTGQRLPVFDAHGAPAGDFVTLSTFSVPP